MAELAAALAEVHDDEFSGLWRENVAVFDAFVAVGTQWRTAPIGGGMAPVGIVYVGLDYAAVRAGLDAAGIVVTPELWAGLRVMEDAARAALNGR
jgi:hypothetical protein